MDPVDLDDDDEGGRGEQHQAAAREEAEKRQHRERHAAPADMSDIWREEFKKFTQEFTLTHRANEADVAVNVATKWWTRYGGFVKWGALFVGVFSGIWAAGEKVTGGLLDVSSRIDTISRRADEGVKAREWIDKVGGVQIKTNADKITQLDYRLDTSEKEIIRIITTVTQNRQERLVQIDEIRKDKEGVVVSLSRINAKLEDLSAAVARLEERSRTDWLGGRKIKPTSDGKSDWPAKRRPAPLPPLQDANSLGTSPP